MYYTRRSLKSRIPRFARSGFRLFLAFSALSILFLTTAPPTGATVHLSPRHMRPSRPMVLTGAASAASAINAVRDQFGLVPGNVTHRFDPLVTAAIAAHADPQLPALGPGVLAEYGLWGIKPVDSTAAQSSAVSSIVHLWVSDDGWRGPNTVNLDCTSPTASGCNGHRRAVLSSQPSAGATLSLDVSVAAVTWQGSPAVSVAVLMVWTEG